MEGENSKKGNNNLQLWGNERTMNLNHLVLTNIQGSPYFKNELYQLKTYHEVVDEIYYKVCEETTPVNAEHHLLCPGRRPCCLEIT